MASSAVSRRRAMRTPPRETRTKPRISYAESSSGVDLESDSESDLSASEPESSQPTTRSRASRSQASQQTRPRRIASINDARSHNSEPAHLQRTKQTRSSTLSRNTRSHQVQQKRPRASSSHRTNNHDEGNSRSSKRRKQSKQSSAIKIAGRKVLEIQGSGVIPAWQSLPYLILVQIFQFATYPLYEEHTFQPLPSGRWLLSVARMCRDFAEPAFTVLYKSPPLVPMVQAHRLVDLLMADPLPMIFKYRQKVESLRIDVGQVVAYTLPGSGLLDLHGLIKELPRLSDLEFYHQKDMSPYRNLDDNVKWTYPESIFEALEYVNPSADPMRGDKTSICRLRSWRWSSRLGGKKYSIEQIPAMHLKPSFESLQKVAFVNYQVPFLKKDEEDPEHEKVLAKAINNLPKLKHLIFESSTLVNAKLLPLLPTGLRNLELINCWEVIASDFAPFLLTHGRQLRCLTLNHNQSLSLAFLPMLGPGCPNLQVLRMNLTYYNLHITYRDSEPLYEKLLEPDQIPAWPSTIQTIELTQLRKWENEAAEVFFQSLLDSAGSLPDLRRLTIQAILNIGWRDRASFRDKWVGSLNRVFKRISKPPKAIFSLPKALQALSLPIGDKEEMDSVPMESRRISSGSNISHTSGKSPVVEIPTQIQSHKVSVEVQPSPPARRSARSATRNLQSGKYVESSDSEPEVEKEAEYEARTPASRAGSRASRLERELGILKETAGRHSAAITSTESSEDDSASNSHNKGKGRENEVIQGMCEVVEVRIDNLRPTETQVTEADFLDEEMSGDDDWNGEDPAEDGYAW
ncbi:hypothetical protein ONS95_010660 [Cadophora gregata]|uniref:uncharacterized protein n=1 Tax=Cadophora gregata TaxID=51156 RepID=UPI0026DAEC34|nr:uncharacterized protein ONS95_010660 [Cadophora gregata]KAK0122424.1 hypothetical protein ONS95_010660 [Cadophora gregata]KAK0127901.1 hypothetical protein ONS96_007401 [Cadophora gregata f. sp. sojae]